MTNTKSSKGTVVLRVLALVAVVAITVLIVINRDKVREFEGLGYPGIFLVAALGSATVILPVPHLAFTFTMGSVFSPWLVGLAAGAGDTLGELSGYLAGFALEDVASKARIYHHFERWMKQNGFLTLFILSVIPNPFFDMASMAGGLAGFPLRQFLLATWLGKTIKAILMAWAGHYGIAWVLSLGGH